MARKKVLAAVSNVKRAEYKALFNKIPAKSQKRDKALSNKNTIERPAPSAKINRRYLQSHDLERIDTKQESMQEKPKRKRVVKVVQKKKSSGIGLIERALLGPRKKKKLQTLAEYNAARGL